MAVKHLPVQVLDLRRIKRAICEFDSKVSSDVPERAYWKIIDGAEESHTVDQSLIAGSSNPATREKV